MQLPNKLVQLESTACLIQGERGQVILERPEIDQGAFFTTLPIGVVRGVGAMSTSLRVAISLEDGRTVESQVYSVGFSVGPRSNASLAVAFEGAHFVLGSKFLEDLGLRISRKSGLLELSRGPNSLRECEE